MGDLDFFVMLLKAYYIPGEKSTQHNNAVPPWKKIIANYSMLYKKSKLQSNSRN